MKKLFIVKIGGNIIDDEKQLCSFLKAFAEIKAKKILVHGGGKIATEMCIKSGMKPKMINGRRITDIETLKIIQMVYAGLVNKNIVAKLQSYKCNAIGMTGADANIVLAEKRPPTSLHNKVGGGTIDYGFVGYIKKVDSQKFYSLLDAEFVPVIAPLTHDGKGQMLNTNADTMASEIAIALAKKSHIVLIYCFEKPGVLRNIKNKNSVIEKISLQEYEQLLKEKIISAGMIPKLDNAFAAIKREVKTVVIGHAKDLKKIISNHKVGTKLII
jgi:acetylglutamate kinase